MTWRDALRSFLARHLPNADYPLRFSTDPRHSLGLRGERLAARHLRRQGCKILERNVRCGKEEIDLIIQDGDTIAFVEVRTRASDDPIPPEDTVGPGKQHRIRRAAAWYNTRNPRPDLSRRYDIIAVVLTPGKPAIIRHHPDAFR